jgi:hypothetical protein
LGEAFLGEEALGDVENAILGAGLLDWFSHTLV